MKKHYRAYNVLAIILSIIIQREQNQKLIINILISFLIQIDDYEFYFPSRIISHGYYNREYPFSANIDDKYFVFISQRMVMIINKETNNMIHKMQLRFKVTDIQIIQQNPLLILCITQRTAYIFSFEVFDQVQTGNIKIEWQFDSKPINGIIKETKNLMWVGRCFDKYIVIGYTNNIFTIVNRETKEFVALLNGLNYNEKILQEIVDKKCQCQEIWNEQQQINGGTLKQSHYTCHFCSVCQQNLIKHLNFQIETQKSYNEKYNFVDLLGMLYQQQNMYNDPETQQQYNIVSVNQQGNICRIIITGKTNQIVIYDFNINILNNEQYIFIYPTNIIELNIYNPFVQIENKNQRFYQTFIKQNENFLNQDVFQVEFLDFNTILVLTIDGLFMLTLNSQETQMDLVQIQYLFKLCVQYQNPLVFIQQNKIQYKNFTSKLLLPSEIIYTDNIYTSVQRPINFQYKFFLDTKTQTLYFQNGYKQIMKFTYKKDKDYVFFNKKQIFQPQIFHISQNGKNSMFCQFFQDSKNLYFEDRDGIFILNLTKIQ